MTNLTLFDTRTKKLQTVVPQDGKTILVYSCGPTIYKPAHIGNMRAYVFADTLNRALRLSNYTVKHIINFTDVGHLTDDADAGEDKVEKQAQEEGGTAREITERIAALFLADLKKLNIPEDHYIFPRATEYIDEQIQLVKTLEEKGLTYAIDDGIYFNTTAYPAYGALGLSLADDTNEYARVTTGDQKRNQHDFALWKLTPSGVKRQQEWDSPWGRGFPGWHAECSAMAMKLLGNTIDIHTGGVDHITVHHNNEIAQSEGATGKTFARIWMHVAYMMIENEKVSKSLNNTYTVNDLEERGYDPLALRYLILQSSYRTPLSFSFKALDAAQTALKRLYAEYAALPRPILPSCLRRKAHNTYTHQIEAAIADDLNTAKVIALLHNILRDTKLAGRAKRRTLEYADAVLGILRPQKEIRRQQAQQEPIPEEVIAIVKKRDEARSAKRYEEADALRKEINKMGYTPIDNENGESTVIKDNK